MFEIKPKKEKIAILYIATGKYIVFWESFYESSEKYFLNNTSYEKHYYVFTDAENIEFEDSEYVHKIYQNPLPWPYITLDRFKIFQSARQELEAIDYIYFFNSNMLFVDKISEEILPTQEKPLVLTRHPGYFDKKRIEFPYEKNKESVAYIHDDEGSYYCMGGLNGGRKKEYLALIDELESRTENDKKSNIVAVWHDESQLNRYAIDFQEKIKILYPSYGYPEGKYIPFPPKIIIRDKARHGGHDFLRNDEGRLKKMIKRVMKW